MFPNVMRFQKFDTIILCAISDFVFTRSKCGEMIQLINYINHNFINHILIIIILIHFFEFNIAFG